MSFRIVPMAEEHLPQIVALEQTCFTSDAWSKALFLDAIADPDTASLLVEGEDGRVLGYAILSTVLDEGELDSIATAPAARRQGVANALLSALIAFGRERLSALMLEVRASNAPAIALYEKHGFAAVGRRKNYYSDPKEDALLMTLTFQAE